MHINTVSMHQEGCEYSKTFLFLFLAHQVRCEHTDTVVGTPDRCEHTRTVVSTSDRCGLTKTVVSTPDRCGLTKTVVSKSDR